LLINGVCLPKSASQDSDKEVLYALTNGEIVDQVDYLNVNNSAIIVTKNELKVLKKEASSTAATTSAAAAQNSDNSAALSDDYMFMKPSGICYDEHNNLYICDSGNNRVKVLNTSLVLAKLIDSATSAQDRLSQPRSVCVQNNILYVCDSGNHRIVTYYVLNDGGDFKFRSVYGRGYGNELGMLSYPLECCADANGIVCVRDHHNNRVQFFSGEAEAFHAIEVNSSREVIYSMTMSDAGDIFIAKMINSCSGGDVDEADDEPINQYYIDIY
jgi:sugar lactone lactonase YvrE